MLTEVHMIKTFEKISDIPRDFFNHLPLPSCLGSLDFYMSLEDSQSLSVSNGWTPKYAVYYIQNQPAGFIPFFSKSHSGDDFSYDQKIGEVFTKKMEKDYYPKLQICIPFMPMEGTKFYFGNLPQNQKKNFLTELLDFSKTLSSNSLHITMPAEEDYSLFEELGFFSSEQSLCYWRNKNYISFEGFLDQMKSKFRSQITVERNVIQKNDYSHEFITADKISKKHVDQFYDLFELTHHRKGWVMSKLHREFFQEFSKLNPSKVLYIFIRKDHQIVAASCHFLEQNMLCGRFWGSISDEHFLHFEVMYYLPIEYCIQNHISKMEIGFAKQHKVIRGFEPKKVKSFHYFFDPQFSNQISNNDFPKTEIFKNIFKSR